MFSIVNPMLNLDKFKYIESNGKNILHGKNITNK